MHFCIQSSGSDLQRRDAARLGAKLRPGVAGSRFHPVSGVAPPLAPLHCQLAGRVQFSAESRSFRGCWGCWGCWGFLGRSGAPAALPPSGLPGGPAKKPQGTNGLDWIRHYKKMLELDWSGKRDMEWMDRGSSLVCCASFLLSML